VCRALSLDAVEKDERFADPVARYRNGRALVEILDAVFAERTLAEWEAELGRHPLIWSPVRRMHEVIDDPQVRAMGYFSEVTHPKLGSFQSVGPPFRMSEHAMPANRPAPELGADNAAVLREAGLSDAEIEKLRR
jgi:crotonobetainyl-CoA:carnitine CoA-transferase CaiB-like acyl-CoA transferase